MMTAHPAAHRRTSAILCRNFADLGWLPVDPLIPCLNQQPLRFNGGGFTHDNVTQQVASS
jgi:hypothetical protein